MEYLCLLSHYLIITYPLFSNVFSSESMNLVLSAEGYHRCVITRIPRCIWTACVWGLLLTLPWQNYHSISDRPLMTRAGRPCRQPYLSQRLVPILSMSCSPTHTHTIVRAALSIWIYEHNGICFCLFYYFKVRVTFKNIYIFSDMHIFMQLIWLFFSILIVFAICSTSVLGCLIKKLNAIIRNKTLKLRTKKIRI